MYDSALRTLCILCIPMHAVQCTNGSATASNTETYSQNRTRIGVGICTSCLSISKEWVFCQPVRPACAGLHGKHGHALTAESQHSCRQADKTIVFVVCFAQAQAGTPPSPPKPKLGSRSSGDRLPPQSLRDRPPTDTLPVRSPPQRSLAPGPPPGTSATFPSSGGDSSTTSTARGPAGASPRAASESPQATAAPATSRPPCTGSAGCPAEPSFGA